MGLPHIPLPTSAVELNGSGATVNIHALTRAQALTLNEYQGRYDEAEDLLIAWATDVTPEEAHRWREAVDFDTVDVLVNAIVELSGLTDQAVPVARRPAAEAAATEDPKAT